MGALKSLTAAIIGMAMLGPGPIAHSRGEAPLGVPTSRVTSASRPKASATVPKRDAITRVSQDVPPPPTPGTPPAPSEPAPAPPTPIEPLIEDPASPRPTEPGGTVSMHYDNRDIRQVLEIFSRSERLNLLISPNVTGSITVNLDGVTREQALEAILSLGNLEAYRTNGLTYIYTAEEYRALNLGRRRPATKVYRLQYVRANEIAIMLRQFLSTDGKVTATPESDEGIDENANFSSGLPTVSASASAGGGGGGGRSGSGSTGGNTLSGEDVVVVQDYPENLMVIDEMIAKLDVMPVQVLIEAIIVRVALTKTQLLGANLGTVNTLDTVLALSGNGGLLANTVGFTPLKLLSASGNIPVTAGGGTGGSSLGGLSFGFIGGNVSGFIQALETIAKTNVLATPRVLVLNKQRAEIQLGNRLGYRTLVTNLTSTVQQVQFINTGTLLRLRPFISDDGMIRMEIHPERSSGLIDANGVPQVNTARMTTNVMVPNGATLVIGGLIDNQDDVTQAGIPYLNRLPIIGAAFRTRNQDVIKNEVVILLTPRLWNPADPEGTNCLPTTKTALDTATRVTQKIELGSDRPFKDGIFGGRVYFDTPGRADRLQANDPGAGPYMHTVRSGENFWTISKQYYKSGRYYKALWGANKQKIAAPDRLTVGDRIAIPRADQLDPALIDGPMPTAAPLMIPEPGIIGPMPPPPPPELPGPFGQTATKDGKVQVTNQARVSDPSPKATTTAK